MAVTRSMARNQNHGASNRKRVKTFDTVGSVSWLDLDENLLFTVMMKLGVVDFFVFSGVCKIWRSLALSSKNKFMASRQPLSISFSTRAYKQECCLHDFEGRVFKTFLPHSRHRMCSGLTCGYLIMFGWNTRDFWLVNPITRHELHFPRFHGSERAKGILVFSPSMSGWVFVVILRYSNRILFSVAGKEAKWNHLNSNFHFLDLHVFKGKIYVMTKQGYLCEMSFNEEPTIKQLEMKNSLMSALKDPEFVSSSENLYVLGCIGEDSYKALEIDLDRMKWVSPEKTIREYTLFSSKSKSRGAGAAAAVKPDTWADPSIQYERFAYVFDTNEKQIGKCFTTDMWYFPRDCLNDNLLKE